MSNNLLKCKICDYTSKQLFQHLKSVHDMSTNEYRNLYGNNLKVQSNFNPQTTTVDKFNSNYVKQGWTLIKNDLNEITNLYTKIKTRDLLIKDEYYKTLYGRAKNRTLIKNNPELYKSIYFHTKALENVMIKFKRDKGNYNFTRRIEFIVELNYNIESLKCECGKSYTWNTYCRYCPDYHKTQLGKPMSIITKSKIRKKHIRRIEISYNNGNQLIPNYNPNSIPIIEQKAKEFGITDLQHAENGGEYHIKELGYWVDGYSKEKNIVIEYYEKHHNKQIKKDLQRQKEIEKFLNCEFIIITENE